MGIDNGVCGVSASVSSQMSVLMSGVCSSRGLVYCTQLGCRLLSWDLALVESLSSED